MSQYEQDEQRQEQGEMEALDDFDAGFDTGLDDGGESNPAGEPGELPANGKPEEGEEGERPADAPDEGGNPPQEDAARIVQQSGDSFSPEPAGERRRPKAEPKEWEAPAPEVKRIEAPEEIAGELEELKRLNPAAAELALEDSPEGESIRARLTEYGALGAQDRAENILEKRERAARAERAEQERNRQAMEAHNQRFMTVLRREHPDYTALLTDPARKVEAAKAMQDIFAWISAKPYAEAAPLMEIAQRGRDPEQVSALITRYKHERGKSAPRKARPEGAYAVPGRGAASAPSGDDGNADDFDAGFNLE